MGKRDFDSDIECFRFSLFLVLLMTRHCCWAWLFCLFCLRCRWGTFNPHCYGFHNWTVVSILSLIKLVFFPTRASVYWWFRSYTWRVFSQVSYYLCLEDGSIEEVCTQLNHLVSLHVLCWFLSLCSYFFSFITWLNNAITRASLFRSLFMWSMLLCCCFPTS